jgi:hypothetical protein
MRCKRQFRDLGNKMGDRCGVGTSLVEVTCVLPDDLAGEAEVEEA